MVSPAKLSHVVLYSRQVPIMRDWYVNVLGGRVVHEAPGVAFLTYDDEHHRVAVADPAALAEVGGGSLVGEAAAELAAEQLAALPPHGLAHVAFTYRTLLELLETWERLRADAILPVQALNHGPTTSLYYADPDGNQIELQIDNFATAEENTAFIESESFARNPIGVAFDPAVMLAGLRTGETGAELTAPTW